MKRLVALMMCAVSLGAAAQVTYPYNPDANDDGFVGVSDVLESVATYGNFFVPEEIVIGDSMNLSEWIPVISAELVGKQNIIDSLLNEYNNLTNLLGMETYLQSSGVCSINYSDGSGTGDFHYHIPATCRFVNMVTYYYGGVNTNRALRLPTTGLFDGQIIEFAINVRTPLSPTTIKIEALQNGVWTQVGSLTYTGCDQQSCQGQYINHLMTNEQLVWADSVWSNTDYIPLEIGATEQ